MDNNIPVHKPLDNAIIAYFVKDIFRLNGLPADLFEFMYQNVLLPLTPLICWDLLTCNDKVKVEEDKVTLHFRGTGSWEHSVLANLPNTPRFSIHIYKSNSMAIGYAPRKGFDINGPTMYTKGLYLYTGNSLYNGGVKSKVVPQVNCVGPAFSYAPDTIITVYLDAKNRTIGFKHNDEDFGICYTDIDMSEDLYPAVSCVGKADIKIFVSAYY